MSKKQNVGESPEHFVSGLKAEKPHLTEDVQTLPQAGVTLRSRVKYQHQQPRQDLSSRAVASNMISQGHIDD